MKKTVLLLAFIFLFSCNNDDNCNTPVTTVECETVDLGITEEDKLIHGGTVVPVPFYCCNSENYFTVGHIEGCCDGGTLYRYYIRKNGNCLEPIFLEIMGYGDQTNSNFYNLTMKIQEYVPNEYLKVEFTYNDGLYQRVQKAWVEFKPENELLCL